MEIDAKIKEQKDNALEKKQHEQGLLDQISELKRKNEFSEVSAEAKRRHDAEKLDIIRRHDQEKLDIIQNHKKIDC